ncbi:MAG: TOBE domain-containing protein, partial [Mesorhizobium sp.]
IAEARVTDQPGAASVTVGDAPAGFEFPHRLLSKLNGHANGGLTLGIRPEGVLVRHDAASGYMPVEASIIEPLGSFDIVDLKVGSTMLRARTKAGYVSGPGEKVHVRIDPEQAHFFDTASGKSLGVRL